MDKTESQEQLLGQPSAAQHSPPQTRDYSPEEDWINQRELAQLLRITPETASRWASEKKLKIFEHGMIGAGKRKYSRRLVGEYQRLKLDLALNRMREVVHTVSFSTE